MTAIISIVRGALRRWSSVSWWHSMFESCALAASVLFVFWLGDGDTSVDAAAVLAIGNSVIGWSFWLALGAAASLVSSRRTHGVSAAAIVGVLNVAGAFALLLIVRLVPLVV